MLRVVSRPQHAPGSCTTPEAMLSSARQLVQVHSGFELCSLRPAVHHAVELLSWQEAIGADYTAMMAQLNALFAQQKALLTSNSPPALGADGDTSAVRTC